MILSYVWEIYSLEYIVCIISLFEGLVEAHSFHCQFDCFICSEPFCGWPIFWMDVAVRRGKGKA